MTITMLCVLCQKPVAYEGARFCGAACSALWESGARPQTVAAPPVDPVDEVLIDYVMSKSPLGELYMVSIAVGRCKDCKHMERRDTSTHVYSGVRTGEWADDDDFEAARDSSCYCALVDYSGTSNDGSGGSGDPHPWNQESLARCEDFEGCGAQLRVTLNFGCVQFEYKTRKGEAG